MSAQGNNMAEVGIEPPTSRSGVRGSTTRPTRSQITFNTMKKQRPIKGIRPDHAHTILQSYRGELARVLYFNMKKVESSNIKTVKTIYAGFVGHPILTMMRVLSDTLY